MDETGRITALNPVSSSGEVRFLTCLADCLNAANWQIAAVGPLADRPRLGLGDGGRLRMVDTDGGRTLRYLE